MLVFAVLCDLNFDSSTMGFDYLKVLPETLFRGLSSVVKM
jgi:hypothetical protein